MPYRALTRIFGFSFAFALQLGAQEFEYAYDGSGNLVAAVVAGAPSVPSITMQPQPQFLQNNAPVAFSVIAGGVGLTYQWFSNDVVILGATGD